MTQPTDKSASGDSTPNFDWIHDPGAGPAGSWQSPSGSDSATSLLPPSGEFPAPFEDATELTGPAESGPSLEELPLEPTAPLFQLPAASEAANQTVLDEAAGITGDGSPPPFIEAPPATDVSAPSAMPATTPPRRAPPRRSVLPLIVLVSYASAVTIALVYLYARYRHPNPHVLESLPDVPPLKAGEVKIVPVDAPMPIGHTLRLGESQRFGNLRVEPLRIIREPAEFAYFSGQSRQPRPATGPILKLWLRFTNLASDQAIAPLDPHLVFSRRFNRGGETETTNFVCRAADKDRGGPLVFLYDHPETSEWDFVGQQLGHVLQPGETFETYVPSAEEGLDQLTGKLLWRVHFRKGFSPRGYGVTTLIEVAFQDDEVLVVAPARTES
jgi:hypothetical protein